MSQGAASAAALAQLCSILAQEHGSPYDDVHQLGLSVTSPAHTPQAGSSAISPAHDDGFASNAPAQTALSPAVSQPTPASGTSIGSHGQRDSPAASSSEPSQRCSQCKQSRNLSTFPRRLTTLKPFQVCKLHGWYWTEEKRELHCAPEQLVSLETVCAEMEEVRNNQLQAGSWLLRGNVGNKQEVAERVCAVGDWVATAVAVRKSRAVSSNAPPTPLQFQLRTRDSESDESWKLSITWFETEKRYIITLKKNQGRQPGLWTRPERSVASKESVADERRGKEKAQDTSAVTAGRSSPFQVPANTVASDAAATLSAQVIELSRRLSSAPDAEISSFSSRPQIIPEECAELERRRLEDAQGLIQVNDPPAELTDLRDLSNNDTRDSRKRRRVEPSLVSNKSRPAIVIETPAPTTAEAEASLDIPVTAPRANYVDFTASQPRARLGHTVAHGRSHAVYHQRPQAQPLSLEELLASPFLEPPSIPLRQRTMVMNAREYYASGAARRLAQQPAKAVAQSAEEGLEGAGQSSHEQKQPEEAGDADGEELYSSSDSEESSSDEGGDDGGDWLTGFVKGQLTGLGGEQASQEEVDELEDE